MGHQRAFFQDSVTCSRERKTPRIFELQKSCENWGGMQPIRKLQCLLQSNNVCYRATMPATEQQCLPRRRSQAKHCHIDDRRPCYRAGRNTISEKNCYKAFASVGQAILLLSPPVLEIILQMLDELGERSVPYDLSVQCCVGVLRKLNVKSVISVALSLLWPAMNKGS